MNTVVRLCMLVLALSAVAIARAETKPGSWAELKAYHSVMSTTFHPAEDGNLEPIKTRSHELVTTVNAWVKSTPPADFNKPAIREKLLKLQTESVALDRLVQAKKATDAELKAALTKLHDCFHDVVGACADEGKDKKH